MATGSKGGKADARAARKARLAAALRENLKRRKQQARRRAATPEEPITQASGDKEQHTGSRAAAPDFRRNHSGE